ncbi:MAG: hypothetical protein KDB15_13885 [Microthrixaceae bacterium]|nr:hypothetical protein [Microthrixaceae bacterium]
MPTSPGEDPSSATATTDTEEGSPVRLPRRRTPVAPVPWSLRRGAPDAPLRRWVPTGTVDSGILADVDPAGLVSLPGRHWSLDWWVGAEDRWHHPSMEASLQQGSIESSPVLSTTMRVPGGTVQHRCGGARVELAGRSRDAAIVELENDSAVPVAVALVVRPYALDGTGHIGSVEMSATPYGGCRIVVDGRDVVETDRLPARVVQGSPAEVAKDLAAGRDEPVAPEAITDEPRRWTSGTSGALEVAFVFPLAHRATMGASVAQKEPVRRGRRLGLRRAPVAPAEEFRRVPALSSVVGGWSAHGAEDPSLEWTVPQASDFLAWSAHVLRVAAPSEFTRLLDPSSDTGRAARAETASQLARGLSSIPAAEIHAAVWDALRSAQRFSGKVELPDGSDATRALLWVAAPALGHMTAPTTASGSGGPDEEIAMAVVGPVAKALRWVERSGTGAPPAALRRLGVALSGVGQPDVANWALSLAEQLDGSRSDSPAERLGSDRTTEALIAGLARELPGSVDPDPRADHESVAGSGARTGSGFDPVEVAALRVALVDAVVADEHSGAALMGRWVPEWSGRTIEAHRFPSVWGRVSFALRWHGENPALLWEVEPVLGSTGGSTAPLITAPVISPGWSAAGWSGEALLTR